ncbi:MAG TPA: hypothetical protein VFC21_10670, partial [Bryobacteraceae bacterium]|nr:hypothetical protein [Bryobacteraceae bacterium]
MAENGVIIRRFSIVVTSNSCAYNVNPQSADVGSLGGSGQYAVTATPSDCILSDPDYPAGIGFQGVGPTIYATTGIYDHGIVYYGTPPNLGPSVTETATYGGATFALTRNAGSGSLQANCPIAGPLRVGATFPVQCYVTGGTPPAAFWSITSGTVPPGTLFSTAGFFTGAPSQQGPFSFVATIKDSASPANIVNVTVSGIIQPPGVSMTCSNLYGPQQTGVFYSQACQPSGGSGSYQWSISDGVLPDGLSLSQGPAGGVVVSGTPTVGGPSFYVLTVSDNSTPPPFEASSTFSTLISSSPPPLSLSCGAAEPVYEVDENLSTFTCLTSGGIPPIRFSIVGGSLPPGITTLGPTPYYVQGIPTAAGDYPFIVRATDSSVPAQVAQQNFDMNVVPMVVATCTQPNGPNLVGQFYTTTCTLSGGVAPYTLTPSLPILAGLTYTQISSTSFTISGTPTKTYSAYGMTVYYGDAKKEGGQIQFTGTVSSGTPAPTSLTVTCDSLGFTTEVGVAMRPVRCTANGGTPPYMWARTAITPAVVMVAASGNSATFNATPTTAGSLPFGITLSDSGMPPQTANWGTNIVVNARLTISCVPASGPVSLGQVYSSTCSAAGGVFPFTWSLSGNLPQG